MSGIIFVIVAAYSVTYILGIQLQSKNKLLDLVFLGLALHERLLKTPSRRFYQGLGIVLLATSTLGLLSVTF